jgi:hypothetical protein
MAKSPEQTISDQIARRWAAPWKATCELHVANHPTISTMRARWLEHFRMAHSTVYRECLAAGIPPRVIARHDLDDPRRSECERKQAIVNALGRRQRTPQEMRKGASK